MLGYEVQDESIKVQAQPRPSNQTEYRLINNHAAGEEYSQEERMLPPHISEGSQTRILMAKAR